MKTNLNMKWTKILTLIFVASMTLLSCGGGDDSDGPTPPTPPSPNQPTPTAKGKFLTMTWDLPAKASEETLSLTGLNSSISEMAGASQSASWLTVTKEAYTSGTPKVKLKATENLQTSRRSAYIVFVAANDTLALTINQAVYQSGTDVNNPNDTPTDQPAYSPSK